MELEATTLLLLVLAAFCAGFVDSIAGGGGLISLPALLLAGVPPVEAVATNKLQSTFGSTTAAYRYWKAGHLELDGALWSAFAASFVGGIAGALCLGLIDASILSRIMPVLLIAIALYFAFAPSLSDTDRQARVTPLALSLLAAGPIGFYDGIFGPGTGSFFTAALVALGGYGLLQATARTKMLNSASNLASLAVFLVLGQALIKIGLIMAAGQMAGAYTGSRLAVKHGTSLIRPLIVVVTVIVAARLLTR